MIKKKCLVVLGLISSIIMSQNVFAQDNFRSEFTANYTSSEISEYSDSTIYGATADLFFHSIETAGHPFKEAAFYERTGSFGFIGGRGEFDGENDDTGLEYTLSGPVYGAMVNIMTPGSPVAIHISIIKSEMDDTDVSGDEPIETDSKSVGFGYFFGPTLLVGFDYSSSQTDESYYFPAIETDEYELFIKYAAKLSGEKAFTINGGITKSDTSNTMTYFNEYDPDGNPISFRKIEQTNLIVSVSGDYYFTRKFSITAGLEYNTGDNVSEEGTTVLAGIDYFITPGIAVYADYEKCYASGFMIYDTISYSLGALARF